MKSKLFQTSELPQTVVGRKKVTRKGNIKFIEKLQKLVVEQKLTLKKCGNNHYQIIGGKYLVNVYPFTDRGPIAHISGTSKGVSLTIEEMIQASFELPTISSTEREKLGSAKRILQKSFNKCYWCKKSLSWIVGQETQATIDHVIPLSKGGTNGHDNLVLSCLKCNKEKGSKLPEKTPWQRTIKDIK